MANVLIQAKQSSDRTKVRELLYDPSADGLVIIEADHHKVHAGEMYSLSGSFQLTAGSTLYFHGLTDGTTAHFRSASIQATGAPISVTFYEDATVSANGTPVTPFNRNRNSANTPTMLTFSGPTVTDPGTLLESGLIPVAGGGKQSGIASLFGTEWVLASATSYLIGVTNNDTNTVTIGYNFLWYEV